LNGGVCRRVNTRRIGDVAPRRLELGTFGIHEVIVLDAIAVHDREAIDIGILSDGAGLRGSDLRAA
jgi:hypothetical protein